MSQFKKFGIYILVAALTTFCHSKVEALTYVTDTAGYAYDESRERTNYAAAIALGTVAAVFITALAIQNSHHSSCSSKHSSHSNGHSSHCGCK